MLQELAESLPTPAKIRQHPGLYDKIPAYAPIAQLDRALASGARGRKFEPCWARHSLPHEIPVFIGIFAFFWVVFPALIFPLKRPGICPGITVPGVAVIAAVETVELPAMPATRDAILLSRQPERDN